MISTAPKEQLDAGFSKMSKNKKKKLKKKAKKQQMLLEMQLQELQQLEMDGQFGNEPIAQATVNEGDTAENCLRSIEDEVLDKNLNEESDNLNLSSPPLPLSPHSLCNGHSSLASNIDDNCSVDEKPSNCENIELDQPELSEEVSSKKIYLQEISSSSGKFGKK